MNEKNKTNNMRGLIDRRSILQKIVGFFSRYEVCFDSCWRSDIESDDGGDF